MSDKPETGLGMLDIVRELAKLNPTAATVILCGVGVAAAAAFVGTLGTNQEAAISSALYVLAVGFTLLFLTKLVANQLFVAVASWFALALLVCWCGTFVAFKVGRERSDILRCVVFFWQSCGSTADAAAAAAVPVRTMATVPALPASSPPGVIPAAYRVTMKFNGAIDRERQIIPFLRGLKDQGWNIAAADARGDRTPAAQGINEVRYLGEAERNAAQVLAQVVQKANISGQEITTRATPGLAPTTLEIWIARP